MRRSKYRRESKYTKWFSGRRRIIAAVATLVAFGGIVTVTQVSDAGTKRAQQRALSACDRVQAPQAAKLSTKTRKGTYTTNGGKVTQHADDGAGDVASVATLRQRCRNWVIDNAGNNTNAGNGNQGNANAGQGNAGAGQGNAGAGQGNAGAGQGDAGAGQGNAGAGQDGQQGNAGAGQQGQDGQQGNAGAGQQGQDGQQGNAGAGQQGNQGNQGNAGQAPPPGAGLGVLANSCADSDLTPHDGFQNGDRCVSTQFGEVPAEGSGATLLITEAPENVGVNQPFTIRVSTRNLIRDRFLAAGQGGYYVESSVLQGGIVRGHFHTACRILNNTNEAPDPAPVPAFFVATEDSQGGRQPDSVAINVPGIPQAGTAQCASWAGDGSHRIPMLQRANQTPAFDAVRIEVGGNNGNNNNGNNNN